MDFQALISKPGYMKDRISYKRRNGYFSRFQRLWIAMVMVFLVFGSVFLYIQNYKITNIRSSEKSFRQLARNFYDKNPTLPDPTPQNFCETIHIGVVCSGFTSNVYFYAALKSLFNARSNPIHFHLLVSNESETVMRLLFKTWQVPQVNVTFYNINNWLKEVRWVPNRHYSGNYGLLKLIFNKIIPVQVTTKILVIDTDLIVLDDLYALWKTFDQFDAKQALGIVENQSPYYLGQLNQQHPWPALGTGFNTGVMLQDLSKLNAENWDNIWVNLTKRYTVLHGQTYLGDQDIFNSVILENPDIIYKLPCFWNTQMSSHSTSSSCYTKFKPKILHWNSPQKFAVNTKDADYFRGFANSVFELNGNSFQNYPLVCNDDPVQEDSQQGDCQKFQVSDHQYRTFLFFLDFKFITDDWDITLVTHLSFDRVELMQEIARMWTGPISFTLYVTDAELVKSMHWITENDVLNVRTDIAYHAVFKQGDFYPINVLRNTGLKYVKTPYVFLVDVDFLPMKSLFEILKDNIKSMGDLTKKALVVPAFEPSQPNLEPPENKIQLTDYLKQGNFRQFQAKTWKYAHAPTDYDKWRTEYEPYKVQWKEHYEPYIVVKSNVVPYDERFLGFGWNKVSHIMELEAQSYDFWVLSDVFIVHQDHAKSCDNEQYKKSNQYRRCIQIIKRNFVDELGKKYHKDFIVSFTDRRKREVDSTTTMYDSTDYFLVWGGKEKYEGKVQPRERHEETKKNDYVYEYDDSFSSEVNYEYDEEDIKFTENDKTAVQDGVTILSDADLLPHDGFTD